MNYEQYINIMNSNYNEYCDFLLNKYGRVEGNYFYENFVPNPTIKRRDENLFIHHIKEDTIAN